MVDLPRKLTPDAEVYLTLLRVEDAKDMTTVLSDPSIYEFIGGAPPDQRALRRRYEAQIVGTSPDRSESWLNWIVRRTADEAAVGYAQATIKAATRTAEIAWVIGAPWQGHGYATMAARALIVHLREKDVTRLTAHIHPRNLASQRVAAHAGLHPTPRTVDGEVEWESQERVVRRSVHQRQLGIRAQGRLDARGPRTG